MYVVYWMERSAVAAHEGQPLARKFDSDQLKAALEFMEGLRRRQREGEPVNFVTMCSENPDSVGLAGAADPSPDYNWKKRRR